MFLIGFQPRFRKKPVIKTKPEFSYPKKTLEFDVFPIGKTIKISLIISRK
jgi:hypothetical protein